MVRATDIITNRLGRVMADEDRASIVHSRHQRLWIFAHDFEMFGGKAIDQRQRRLKRGHLNDGAKIAPAGSGNVAPRQCGDGTLDTGLNGAGELGIIGDQNRLGGSIMFSLREKIRASGLTFDAIAAEAVRYA